VPAKSQAQQRLFAVAEHDPDKLYPQNKRLASLGKSKLHDFAATKRSSLPARVSKAPSLTRGR